MSADIVAYSAHPEDHRSTLKIVCHECDSEWGWSLDVPAAWERLEALVDWHNRDRHGWKRVFS